jgi:hypothetical protein
MDEMKKLKLLKILPPPCLSDEFEIGGMWRIDELLPIIQNLLDTRTHKPELDEEAVYKIMMEVAEDEVGQVSPLGEEITRKQAKAICSKFSPRKLKLPSVEDIVCMFPRELAKYKCEVIAKRILDKIAELNKEG